MAFITIKGDSRTHARSGILKTPQGHTVETPAYVIVGTYGQVQLLSGEDLKETKTQMVIANTYQLWRIFGEEKLRAFPGLHAHMGFDGVLMTDSGGFQVFSLGAARDHGIGKIGFPGDKKKETDGGFVSLSENGAEFLDKKNNFSGFLTPEKSVAIQESLGADCIFVLDECTSPLHDYAYTKKSLELTNRWAERCIQGKKRTDQLLYGIVQGGTFKDLREASAQFLAALPFDGYGIGGSLGKEWEEMLSVLDWAIPLLPHDRPRHLLGIGNIRDIFEGVERGVDTFDCIVPTREGRNGAVWTHAGRESLRGSWKNNEKPIDEACDCKFCSGKEKISRGKIWELDRAAVTGSEERLIGKQMVKKIFSYHNVRFFNSLMENIREAIKNDSFSEYKKDVLNRIKK